MNTDENVKLLLNGAASTTDAAVEKLRIAVGAEPRRSTTDDTAKPNADPVGYQGTAAEDEQIADALDAIAAEYLTAPSVAEALRAYYSQDPTGAGRRQFDTWFLRAQPDVEIMPGGYNLVGRARDGGAFPIVDLDGVWADWPRPLAAIPSQFSRVSARYPCRRYFSSWGASQKATVQSACGRSSRIFGARITRSSAPKWMATPAPQS